MATADIDLVLREYAAWANERSGRVMLYPHQEEALRDIAGRLGSSPAGPREKHAAAALAHLIVGLRRELL